MARLPVYIMACRSPFSWKSSESAMSIASEKPSFTSATLRSIVPHGPAPSGDAGLEDAEAGRSAAASAAGRVQVVVFELWST